MEQKINPEQIHLGEVILIRTEKRGDFSPILPLLKYFCKQKLIYICSNKSPCDLVYTMKRISLCLDNVCIINASGLNDLNGGNIQNIDCDNLTQICIELNKLLKKDEKKKIIVLDCPLGFLLHNEIKLVRRFVLDVIKKVKKDRSAILIIVCNHNKKLTNTFNEIKIFIDKLYEL